jgi:hypothetical protein
MVKPKETEKVEEPKKKEEETKEGQKKKKGDEKKEKVEEMVSSVSLFADSEVIENEIEHFCSLSNFELNQLD